MPKKISEEELAAVETAVRQRTDGIPMGELVGTDATSAVRRAMQRRLKKLIEQGRVRQEGEGRGARYFAADAPPTPFVRADDASKAAGGLFITPSTTGEEIRRLVHRPLNERTPVGYQREFLSSYRPNETYYLSLPERRRLAEIGAVSEGGREPAGTFARQILNRLLIDLSWNSSRLEGNTYSILDTHVLLELGRHAEGKSAQEAQMILNHKDAIEFLVDGANEVGFNRHSILNLHALLSNNLLPDPQASGRLRRSIIGISQSVYGPLQTPAIIEECFAELLKKTEAISDPFEQSLFVVIQLPYLQPFEDVNKRVSRLAANMPFIRRNLSPISFVDVENAMYTDAMLGVYELNQVDLARDMFIWAYERSALRYAAIRQSLGEPDPFRIRYRDELRTIVAQVVHERLSKEAASSRVEEFVERTIPSVDRKRFVETAETELVGLHEGNFARYRIRPSEFFAWKAAWGPG